MPPGTERGASGVAVLDGRIVVAGGFRGGASVPDASVFDPQTNAWSPLQPLGVARDHLAAGTVDGRVYAVAGRAAGVLKGALEVLDAASNTWQPARRHPHPARRLRRRDARRAAGGDGRRGKPGRSERRLPRDRELRPGERIAGAPTQPMRTARHGIGAAVVGALLVVPGGATREGFGAVDVNESFGYQ